MTGVTSISFVAMFSGSVGGGITLLVICLMLWSVFVVAARRYRRSYQRRQCIYREGLIGTGTIEQIRPVMTDTTTRGSHTTTTHIVHEVLWSLSVGGQRFTSSTNVDSQKVAHLRVGDPIWILVDPNDFSQSIEWPAGFVIAESTETTPQDRIKSVPQDRILP